VYTFGVSTLDHSFGRKQRRLDRRYYYYYYYYYSNYFFFLYPSTVNNILVYTTGKQYSLIIKYYTVCGCTSAVILVNLIKFFSFTYDETHQARSNGCRWVYLTRIYYYHRDWYLARFKHRCSTQISICNNNIFNTFELINWRFGAMLFPVTSLIWLLFF